jgi:hypothetical protein
VLTREFLKEFRRKCELSWSRSALRPEIYGFQFQAGTRWSPGLSESEIAEYERAIGFRCPEDFKTMLREMNGTDLPTVNIFGSSGHPRMTSVGVYSFPRDLDFVRSRIEDVRQCRPQIRADLAEQNFELLESAKLVADFQTSVRSLHSCRKLQRVLSILAQEPDAIVYADSLQEYLVKEFLP